MKLYLSMTFTTFNKSYANSFVRVRESLKVPPRLLINFKRFKNISRDNKVLNFIFCWIKHVGNGGKPHLCHFLLSNKIVNSLFVHLRYTTRFFSYGESLCESFFINSFDGTVDPSIAKRLQNCIVIGNTGLAGLFTKIYQPNFRFALMVFCKPCTPRYFVCDMKCFFWLHNYYFNKSSIGTPSTLAILAII